MRVRVCLSAGVLPEQGSAAVLGGPANYQFLLPLHVLPGQTVAATAEGSRHVEGLVQPTARQQRSAAESLNATRRETLTRSERVPETYLG